MRRLLALPVLLPLLLGAAPAPAAMLLVGHGDDGNADLIADANGGAPVRLSVVRDGQTLPGAQGSGPNVHLSEIAARSGDQLVVEQPEGTVVGSVTYDDMPTFDGPVCAGATSLSATVGSATSVYAAAYDGWTQTSLGTVTTSLAGGHASLSYPAPLPAGYFAQITFSRRAGDLDVSFDRTVVARDCNAPATVPVPGLPAPPSAPPPSGARAGDTVPPLGLIHTPRAPRIRDLLRRGLPITVMVSEASQVNLALVVGGRTVARGAALASKGGGVRVVMRPTKAGRAVLRRSHRLRAQVTGELRDPAGNRLHMGVQVLALRR